MSLSHRVPLALALMTLGACASAPPSQRTSTAATVPNPCRGRSFDADSPDTRCMDGGELRHSPAATEVRISLLEPPPTVTSGASATFTVQIANVSGRVLPIDLFFGCGAFVPEASNTTARTFESDCGGICGHGDILRLELEPGGVIRKRATLQLAMRKIEGGSCAERALGPLPPGRYTLEVPLPWTDPSPIPGNPDARSSRVFAAPITVVAGESRAR